MNDKVVRALSFYGRWLSESFTPAYSWARWVGAATLFFAPLGFYLEIAQKISPKMAPLLQSIPEWIPGAAFASFCIFFGGRLVLWPYWQHEAAHVQTTNLDAELLSLKDDCLSLIQRCKVRDWVHEKNKLYADMQTYFDRAAFVVKHSLGQREALLLFDDSDVERSKIEPPLTLGGWAAENYPKLAVSSIRLNQFLIKP